MHRLSEQDVLDALRAAGFKLKREGTEWHSGCPLCGEGENRLRVHTLNGTLITQCRKCGTPGPEIWRALGLFRGGGDAEVKPDRPLSASFPSAPPRTLGPPRRPADTRHPVGDPRNVPAAAVETHYLWIDAASGDRVIQGRWDWLDAAGKAVKSMRFPAGSSKAFLVFPLGLERRGPVFVAEGAKAALALYGLGFAVLGLTDDGAKPTPEMLRAAAGRHVICWPDYDRGGAELMERARDAALGAGAVSVSGIWPPSLGLVQKGQDAADWIPIPGVDVVSALRPALMSMAAPARDLEPIDRYGGSEVPLPVPIIAFGRGNLLPAGDVAIIAGAGGEGKSRLTLQMAIVAAAGEPGAMLCPFSAAEVSPPDGSPFNLGEGGRLSVRGGPVVMVSWEDREPWLAQRARHVAEDLDRATNDRRHRDVIGDASRVVSVALRYSEALFGVADGERRDSATRPLAGWEPLWSAVQRVRPVLVVIDPINLATEWEGYSVNAPGRFIGALREGVDKAVTGILLVGHTGKQAMRRDGKASKPMAGDVMGSFGWSQRCRATIIMQRMDSGVRFNVVKANYAPDGQIDLDEGRASHDGGFRLAEQTREKVQQRKSEDLQKRVLEVIPHAPEGLTVSAIVRGVGMTPGSGNAAVQRALQALEKGGGVSRTAPATRGRGERWSRPPSTNSEASEPDTDKKVVRGRFGVDDDASE